MPQFLRNLAAAVLASGFACNPSCLAQQASNKELPLVWVLSTGGTIAGTGASSTNLAEYKGGTILGEDLVKAVPEIKQFANVKVQQIINIRSPDVKLENLLTLANGINGIFATDPSVAGVVVGWLDAPFDRHQRRRTPKPPQCNSNRDSTRGEGKGRARRDER
jgi:L-asparaginase/Glu-tRNA(Gln) amidotransferase subunit D